MVPTSTPRRGIQIPAANLMPHESLLPIAQNSPISMRYSVSGGKTIGTGGGSHQSVADLNKENRAVERAAIQWTMLVLLLMAVCSALFSLIALQFHFANMDRFMRSAKSSASFRGVPDVIRDVIASFDVAVVVLSIVAFFVSTLQLLFLMKIVKSQQPPNDTNLAMEYIKSTSFLRIVAFSFWFASIGVFVVVLMLTCSIDPSRSVASKCVAVTLGSSALLLALVFAVKTLVFWAKISYSHVYRDDCYNYLSTLV